MDINKNYNENCLETIAKMPDNFIDLTITSPPYDTLRKYNNVFNVSLIAKELLRVTKYGGVCVWIVSDATINGSETGTSFKQALEFINSGWNLHDTMIYASDKPPLNHNRYEQEFEFMFIFSNGKPKTFNPIIIECKYVGEDKKASTFRQKGADLMEINIKKSVRSHKIKGNIWRYSTGFNKSTNDNIAFKHPAIFPEKLVNDHIISWSNKGDLVYDPFMGSGTTAKMCIANNRDWVGSEISPEYCDIIKKRISSVQPSLY